MQTITANPPNLDSPNFGGLNMNDLLDATDGFSADAFAGMTADAINKAASKFDPDFFMDLCEELLQDVSEFTASSDDILDMIDDMSSALKPLELIRIMKGQKTDRDLGVMRDAIESDVLKHKSFADVTDVYLFDSKGYEKSHSFDHNLIKNIKLDKELMLAGNIKFDDKLKNYEKIANYLDLSGGLETSGLKDTSKIDIFLNNLNKLKNET